MVGIEDVLRALGEGPCDLDGLKTRLGITDGSRDDNVLRATVPRLTADGRVVKSGERGRFIYSLPGDQRVPIQDTTGQDRLKRRLIDLIRQMPAEELGAEVQQTGIEKQERVFTASQIRAAFRSWQEKNRELIDEGLYRSFCRILGIETAEE